MIAKFSFRNQYDGLTFLLNWGEGFVSQGRKRPNILLKAAKFDFHLQVAQAQKPVEGNYTLYG